MLKNHNKFILNLFACFTMPKYTELYCLALVRNLHCLVVRALHQHHKDVGLIPAGDDLIVYEFRIFYSSPYSIICDSNYEIHTPLKHFIKEQETNHDIAY